MRALADPYPADKAASTSPSPSPCRRRTARWEDRWGARSFSVLNW